jgi:hypothetical protein
VGWFPSSKTSATRSVPRLFLLQIISNVLSQIEFSVAIEFSYAHRAFAEEQLSSFCVKLYTFRHILFTQTYGANKHAFESLNVGGWVIKERRQAVTAAKVVIF